MRKNDFLRTVNVAAQRVSNEKIVKIASEFEGIEGYLYIPKYFTEDYKDKKVTAKMLEEIQITESDAWRSARKNLCRDTEVQPLEKVMGLCTGHVITENESSMGVYVVKTKYDTLGAGAIFNHEAFKNLARKLHVHTVAILPSSIHEILVMTKGILPLENLNQMVKDVNVTVVSDEEQLADRAFLLTV